MENKNLMSNKLKMNKFMFNVKQLKMNKFIRYIWQLIICTSNATLEVPSLRSCLVPLMPIVFPLVTTYRNGEWFSNYTLFFLYIRTSKFCLRLAVLIFFHFWGWNVLNLFLFPWLNLAMSKRRMSDWVE